VTDPHTHPRTNLGANLLVGQARPVPLQQLILHVLPQLLGPAAFVQLPEGKGQSLRQARGLDAVELVRGRETWANERGEVRGGKGVSYTCTGVGMRRVNKDVGR